MHNGVWIPHQSHPEALDSRRQQIQCLCLQVGWEGVYGQSPCRTVSLWGNPWTVHRPMWGQEPPFPLVHTVAQLELVTAMHKPQASIPPTFEEERHPDHIGRHFGVSIRVIHSKDRRRRQCSLQRCERRYLVHVPDPTVLLREEVTEWFVCFC